MKSKLLYHTTYLSLYETEKGFVYAQRQSINSIASLCFKYVDNEVMYLVHYQPMPEIEVKTKWDDLYPCPITGAIDHGETPLEAAIRETKEEGGIDINPNNFYDYIEFVASTQMNEIVHCFVFDVTGLKQEDPLTDGSIFEAVAKNKWLTQKEIEEILFNKKEAYLSSLFNAYWLVQKHLKEKQD
ncbi:NUDIX hydrolase [Mycoplasma bradburyae]|uniref:NUDIX hydrolase n=1 Tax=Mycoplasma bradburyae TaxID=2963128 RepID=A0AAW6HP57_9MOLU|nr:NUDIX hydrolase [Mycoplasma bradburyae]MDC4183622.1 NUDIX hydrolase [Mycoplasma bradburyae]